MATEIDTLPTGKSLRACIDTASARAQPGEANRTRSAAAASRTHRADFMLMTFFLASGVLRTHRLPRRASERGFAGRSDLDDALSDHLSELGQSLFSFHELRHGWQACHAEDGFPPIDPVVTQEALHDVGPSNALLPLGLLIEFTNDGGDLAGVGRQRHHRIHPREHVAELGTLRGGTDHDGPRRGPLEIP